MPIFVYVSNSHTMSILEHLDQQHIFWNYWVHNSQGQLLDIQLMKYQLQLNNPTEIQFLLLFQSMGPSHQTIQPLVVMGFLDPNSAMGWFSLLAAIGAFAHHDWSAGYMRPETHWNWACLSGLAAGRRVGLNLSCGVNETSFTENCYWLDGELLKVDTVCFAFDRQQPLQPWHISSHDGQVALRFDARGLHQERMNLGILASNFKQIFGQFSGVLRPSGRPEVVIDGQWGFVEDQYVKW